MTARPARYVLIAFTGSALPFLLLVLFPGRLHRVMDTGSYVVFHNTVEFFSIMVSLSVFGVGWFGHDQSRDRHALFLGTAFLATGLLDFMHASGNAAMPAFFTVNSTNKSTQFWIVARLLESSALLASAFVLRDEPTRWLTRRNLLAAALGVPAVTFVAVTFFPSTLPATFAPGTGLTPFKVVSEYVVIALLLLAVAAYWRRMRATGDAHLVHYVAAFVILIFGEAAFASYKSGFDTHNVLGHLYKVAAFYLIYKAAFVAAVAKPYVQLSRANEQLRTEIAERQQAEAAIRSLNEELERRVEERTSRLAAANRALEHGREWLRVTLSSIGDAVLACDTAGRVTFLNPIAEALTGWPASEALGRPSRSVFDTIDEQSRAPGEDIVARVLRDGRPAALPSRAALVTRDGREIPIADSAAPIVDLNGDVTGVVVVFHDVTDERRAEEALREADRRKDEFLGMVSHELRNPLAAIHNSVYVLDHDPGAEPASRARAIIRRQTEHLTRLVDDLLDVTRIARGKMDLRRSRVDLRDVVARATDDFRTTMEGRGVALRMELPEANVWCDADPTRVTQIVVNLLHNSAKFTRPGDEVRLSLEVDERDALIRVRDTGEGIEPTLLPRVFAAFVQGERTLARTEGGLGLGLALVKGVAELHGGSVHADSGGKGLGAEFVVRLPKRADAVPDGLPV